MHPLPFTFRHLCALLALTSSAFAQSPSPRQVVAPPSDILAGIVRLPEPAASATRSRAQVQPVHFQQVQGRWQSRTTLHMERDGSCALALLGPAATEWRVLAAPRGAALLDVDRQLPSQKRSGFAGDELPGWTVVRRDWHGLPSGEWDLWIEAPNASSAASGWMIASGSTDAQVEAYWSSAQWVRAAGIAVLAKATGSELAQVLEARAFLESSTVSRELSLHDDGLHSDGAAQDGLWGLTLPADLSGALSLRVQFTCLAPDGLRFERSAVLACTLVEPTLSWMDHASAHRSAGSSWRVAIDALPLDLPRRLQVAAELWARREERWVPICWLARIQEPQVDGPRWVLELEFDERWLDLAQAGAEFELRELRVQDPDTQAVLDYRQQLPLHAPGLAQRPPQSTSALTSSALLAALGMPSGPHTPATPQLLQPALMLVHGYCSSASIWPAAQFTQPKLEFLDPNANRTHDAFAQLIAARAQTAQLSSFGVVGHSQGGPAALHLLTYYTSGLDFASGARRIQSVASPYQGTPLASLGSFACGVNDNMTPAGSATWLAGIPTWARAEVSYWTTSNSGSACNFFTGLILADPEDGTVEKVRGELIGGVSMGHRLGWCHTTGMSNPANYTDATRNQAMNAAAAR